MKEKAYLQIILDSLGKLNLHPLLTPRPINLSEEMYKLNRNFKYNPSFRYVRSNLDLEHVLKELEAVSTKVEKIGFNKDTNEYLSRVIEYLFNIAKLLDSIGNDQMFNLYVRKVYNWDLSVDPDICEKLYDKCVQVDTEEVYDAYHIQREISKALSFYGLDDWSAEVIDSKRSMVSVGIGSKKIYISKNSTRNILGVKKLIAHEVESHVLRFENSLQDNIKLILDGSLPGKILCEEGFAVYSEFLQNTLERKNASLYILRCKLSTMEEASFADLVEICRNEYDLDLSEAFDVVYRLKRGFCDTSKPGIHLKDSAYYKGFELMIKNLQGIDDIRFMLSGRVSFYEKHLANLGIITKDDLILPNWVSNLDLKSTV